MSEQRLDRLRQMTTEEQAEAFKRMNEAIERIVADPSAVPLESMIEEMQDVDIVLATPAEDGALRWIAMTGVNVESGLHGSVREAVEALYAAWRERE